MAGIIAPQPVFQGFNSNGSFLAGGLLSTFAAGTSTPQATYTDSTLLTPNTNPVVLNALGQANVWLTPGLAYKFNLTDSSGNQMPDFPVDQINGNLAFGSVASNLLPAITNTYSLGSSSFQWSAVYATTVYEAGIPVVSYPSTPAELTALALASGSIVNFTYPEGCVDRYVANTTPGTGTIDCAPGFNSAFQVALAIGCPITFGATVQYQLLSIVNFTTSGGPNEYGVLVIYNGAPTPGDAVTQPIIANHSLTAVFDCTGTIGIQFERVGVETGAGFAPKVCWLFARNVTGDGAGFQRLGNCIALGSFANAVYYNFAAENDALSDCYFQNEATTASTAVLLYTAGNVSSLTSIVTGGIAAGWSSSTSWSNTNHTVLACELYNSAGTNSSYCVYLDVCTFLRVKDCWGACFSASAGGEGYFGVLQTNGPSTSITIDNWMGEQNGTTVAAYGVLFIGSALAGSAGYNVAWNVKNCLFPNTSLAFSCNGTMDQCYFENIYEQPSVAHGLDIVTALACEFHTGALLLTITTSDNNLLVGYSDRWTITTRSNDYWVDIGTANKTWTPALGTLGHVGALTYSNQKCLVWGNQCHVSFQVSAGTSITGTAGQTITGLPFAAVGSNTVTFTDLTTLSSVIPNGFTSGSTIFCPTFASIGTNTLLVDAVYFIA